jgi:hypothetical protein
MIPTGCWESAGRGELSLATSLVSPIDETVPAQRTGAPSTESADLRSDSDVARFATGHKVFPHLRHHHSKDGCTGRGSHHGRMFHRFPFRPNIPNVGLLDPLSPAAPELHRDRGIVGEQELSLELPFGFSISTRIFAPG